MTIERIKDFEEIILPFFTKFFLKVNYENLGKSDAEEFEKDFSEILNLAAKALQQQSCDDAVSRQAVLDKKELVELEDGQSFYCISPEDVETLPPVTPQQRTGHWIYENFNWRCSECNETPKTLGYVGTADFMTEHFKYCNHCGARMIEPQAESEEMN